MNNVFKTDKDKIRILQVSDAQDLQRVRPSMIEMLNKAYDTLSPDLVVLTGDNILGNHLLDAPIGSRQFKKGREATLPVMRQALYNLLDPIAQRKIPFAMIYGNHDDMNDVTKEEQMQMYRSYRFCMEGNKSDSTVDCDTYVIKIYKGEKLIYALFMLDSAWQDKFGDKANHEEIKKSTVEWFVKTNDELKKENKGKGVPALIFTHIPLPAMKNLYEKCTPNTKGAIRDRKDGNYYILNPRIAHGTMGEEIAAVKDDNGLFDEAVKAKNIKAIITGHDHRNVFEGTYKGIKFIQTGAASFRCYGSEQTRGVRTIDICADGSFDTKFYTYYDLMGKTVSNKLKYFRDSDENEKKKYTLLGTAILSLTAGVTGKAIAKFIK